MTGHFGQLGVLYIRGEYDTPHTGDRLRPGQAVCGVPLNGSATVTELQLITYFGGRRCPDCARKDPTHGGPR